MSEREQGPVEILCREIGVCFHRHMEADNIFIEFVAVLVSQVADIRGSQVRISEIPGIVRASHPSPSEDSAEVLRRVHDLLSLCSLACDPQTSIDGATEVHNFIHEVAGSHR